MTEIAFHFNASDPQGYVCRLLRKALGRSAQVVVTAPSATLDALDAALWTFSPLDFVPHCRADAPAQVLQASPVVLAPALSDALPHHDVLVNLDVQVPRGFERFARVLEIVSTQEQDRQSARARWKHYAERGYKIVRHDLAQQDGTA